MTVILLALLHLALGTWCQADHHIVKILSTSPCWQSLRWSSWTSAWILRTWQSPQWDLWALLALFEPRLYDTPSLHFDFGILSLLSLIQAWSKETCNVLSDAASTGASWRLWVSWGIIAKQKHTWSASEGCVPLVGCWWFVRLVPVGTSKVCVVVMPPRYKQDWTMKWVNCQVKPRSVSGDKSR